MAHDLIFKTTKRNWARGSSDKLYRSLDATYPTFPPATTRLIRTLGETDESDESGWNPFKTVRKGLSKGFSIATKSISVPFNIASKAYGRVTPKELKSILRWTPYGLAIRAGVKLAPDVKKGLAKTVKWSPYGMAFRGAEYGLTKAVSRLSGANPDEGILFPSPTEIDEGWVPDEMYVATEAGGPEQDAMVRQLGWLVPRKRFFRRVKKQGQPFGTKRSGHRGQGLRLLAQRAAQGDQAAKAKLRQVNTRLASKASSGDPQAAARLRRFQEEAARVSTPSPFYPSQPYPPISTTPPLSYSAPTSPAEVYITANPAALSDEQDSYYESDEY